MADIDVRPRAPGPRPWILGILLLVILAALGLWLLDGRGDDRALQGVSGPVAPPPSPFARPAPS